MRHFSPDLEGWEEKDKPQSFPLTAVTPQEATFGGLTYRLFDPDTLQIRIEMKQKDGSIEVEEHKYYRVRPS